MSFYYSLDEKGKLKKHKYTEGDICSGIKSDLPPGRYKIIDKKLVRLGEPSGVPSHYGSDSMGAIKNPVDGKTYDSKSAYYKAVKNAGCVVMGNDVPKTSKREVRGDFNIKKELKQSLQQHLGRR